MTKFPSILVMWERQMVDRSGSTKHYSEIQENMVASYLGWKRVTGSGSRPGHPGDVVGEHFLCECKTHTLPNRPLVFDFDVWDKIAAESRSQFKQPALVVDDGSQIPETTWVLFQPASLDLFPEIGILCKNTGSYRISLQSLQEKYEDAPYIWIIMQNFDRKFALMPLPAFKEHLNAEGLL